MVSSFLRPPAPLVFMGNPTIQHPAPSQPGAGEFSLMTVSKVTDFAFKNVTPPSRVYIALNDLLVVAAASNFAAANVTVRGRLLRVDGQIIEIPVVVTGDGTRVLVTKTLELAEGYLLSLTAQANAALNPGQSLFVQCGIQRPSGSGVQFFETLLAGYISGAQVLSYPEASWASPVPGQGALRSITGTLPGAGTEISEVVPAGARWRLVAFTFSLTTAVAVANRIVHVTLDDGALVYYNVVNDFTQVASTTQRYNAAPVGGRWLNNDSDNMLPTPIGLVMPAGHRIRTATTALQAADAYTAPQYLVEEFLSIA